MQQNKEAYSGQTWRSRTLIAALFLMVFASKLVLLNAFASPLPFWDQWDAEAANLYKPYLDGSLSWQALFASHNEHRIIIPRLLALVLFELAGQWDPVLQMIVNAALHAAFAAAMFGFLIRVVDQGRYMALFAFTATTFIIPIGWENMMSGFQSQFYFLLLFSLSSLYLFVSARAFSRQWALGLAMSILAYFSMSSGALTVAAAVPVLVFQIVVGVRARRPAEFVSIAVLATIAAVMIALVTEVVGHESLKAHNVLELAAAMISLSALPLATIVGSVVVQFPLFWLVGASYQQKPAPNEIVWLLLGLAVWVGMQMLSLSVGRAAIVMSSRYLDLLTVGYPVSMAALFMLCASPKTHPKMAVVPAIWACIIMTSLVGVGYLAGWPRVLERHAITEAQQNNVAAYFETKDMDVLTSAPFMHIPYPDPQRLAYLLNDPTIGATLYSSIRPADADTQTMLGHTLLRGKFSELIAVIRKGLLLIGPALFAIGFGMAFLVACWPLRPIKYPEAESSKAS